MRTVQRRRHARLRLALRNASALAAVAFASACSTAPPAPPGPLKVFRVRYGDDIRSLDWTRTTAGINSWALKNIMEGLVDIGPAGDIRPRLAESYSVSSDGDVYVFRLRKDVRWSDGEPLRAQHFVDAWKEQPWMAGVGALALDELTLQATLANPSNYFLWRLAYWAAYPVRADLMEKHGDSWSEPEKLVTLGPYRVLSWEKGKRVTFARNAEYWGAQPSVDEVVFEVIADDAEAARQYKEGRLSHFWPATPDGRTAGKRIRKPGGYHALGVFYLQLSNRSLTLPQRRAIASAVDRRALLRKVGTEHRRSLTLVHPKLLPSAIPFTAPKERKGAPKLRWKRALRLLTLESPQNRVALEEVARQLSKKLKLRCKTRYLEGNAFEEALARGQFDVALEAIYPDWPDAGNVLDAFRTGSVRNDSGWRHVDFDRLLDQAQETDDGSARASLYRQALHILLREEVIAVPLYHPRIDYFLGKGVKGFKPNPIGDADFRPIDVLPEPEQVRAAP